MKLLAKVSRLAKPGMFGAVCVAIAITAAATYTAKLSLELDTTLDAVDKAREEVEVLETRRASAINDIQGFEMYRDQMIKDMYALMANDIRAGKYDEAVNQRMWTLSGGEGMEGESGAQKMSVNVDGVNVNVDVQ